MLKILNKFKNINDERQECKVKHKLIDIVAIALFATLANANEWGEIEDFAYANEEFLRKHLELTNGIPSHDTIQRVMSTIHPKVMQQLVLDWNELINEGEGEKLKKIINIDGKTMRGSASAKKKALHIVSAYSKEDGICFGQTVVEEKQNEIIAIPDLLDEINITNCIITIDAMGTQTKIVDKIISKKADYVLALKRNQGNLHKDVEDYFGCSEFRERIKKDGGYLKTVEKAHGQIETREYFQTNDVDWIPDKKNWKNLKSIGIAENTIDRNGIKSVKTRYYINSIPTDILLFAKTVREHWAIEVMHWHLDVTFREDSNKTLEKTAAQNQNILRKLALSILKLLDVGKRRSLKRKRYMISVNASKFLEQILNI